MRKYEHLCACVLELVALSWLALFAMADIKDILGVPRADGEGKEPKQKEKKPKQEKLKRPEGMSREAFALLGGSHPIATSELLSSMTGVGAAKGPEKAKPKPSTKGIPCWQFKGFKNSARCVVPAETAP